MTTIATLLRERALAPAMAGVYVKSVAIASTYSGMHAATLTITWSWPEYSERDAPELSLPGVSATVMSRPADSVIRLPLDYASLAQREATILDTAWMLGAWDCVRMECQAGRDRAWAFGGGVYVIADAPTAIGDGLDQSAADEAHRDGYVYWRFVPLALATPIAKKRWQQRDRTLRDDCTRDGDPNIGRGAWHNMREALTGYDHIYQLGRGNHGNRSKNHDGRRAV